MAAKKKRTPKQLKAIKRLVALNKKRARAKRKGGRVVKSSAKKRQATAKKKRVTAKSSREFFRLIVKVGTKNKYFAGDELLTEGGKAALFSSKSQAEKVGIKLANQLNKPVGIETVKK